MDPDSLFFFFKNKNILYLFESEKIYLIHLLVIVRMYYNRAISNTKKFIEFNLIIPAKIIQI